MVLGGFRSFRVLVTTQFLYRKAWFSCNHLDHPNCPSRFRKFQDDPVDWDNKNWQFSYERLDHLSRKQGGFISD